MEGPKKFTYSVGMPSLPYYFVFDGALSDYRSLLNGKNGHYQTEPETRNSQSKIILTLKPESSIRKWPVPYRTRNPELAIENYPNGKH